MSSAPPILTVPEDHLGLYVHVPFCVRKCRYCAFTSAPLAEDPALPDRYLDALSREARVRRRELDRPLHSIYLGGGTPTVLSAGQLRRLWDEVIAPFPRWDDAEISLEANPGTLDDDILAVLATLPVSRVSLGVQSMHVEELALLGRIHTPQQVEDGVRLLREIGIPGVNLDLLYAFPRQTAARWQETLAHALSLQPTHLSLYSLIPEDGTPLAREIEEGILAMPGEEEEEMMVSRAEELLGIAGYRWYEVSNAAQPGHPCRHNLGYWLGREYLGLGVGAVSAAGALRWRNAGDTRTYIAQVQAGRLPVAYAERLSAERRLLERVMLGLRLHDGFSLAEAEACCQCRLDEIAGDALVRLIDADLLVREGDILRLAPSAFRLANYVVAQLMAAQAPPSSGETTPE